MRQTEPEQETTGASVPPSSLMSTAARDRRLVSISAWLLLAGVAPQTAWAQAAGEPPPEQAPVQVEQIITVTATRLPIPLSELSAAATIVSADQLRSRPALGLDEALTWIPQLSLFRRTPARAAHPTAQGVNLRGIAPSGTSRALVLVDGIPLTDAFGGWVYWNRVPVGALEQVEIALGGGSATYGSQALGGTVQLVGRRPPHSGYDLGVRTLAGEQSTRQLDVFAATALGGVQVLVAADLFHTDGYVPVAKRERGAVDSEVASAYQSGLLRLALPQTLTLALDGLHERRGNGTAERINSTDGYGFGLTWQPDASAASGRSASVFGHRQVFRSRFSSVADDRASEVAVLDQRVTSTDLGARGHLWRQLGAAGVVSFGGDWRRVSGVSRETVLSIDLQRAPGGTQNIGGLFATAQLQPAANWSIDLSMRADRWHNDARAAGSASRSEFDLSPRIGVLFSPTSTLNVRASAYRSFRAPTLNELYRQFRVGNVITSANDGLDQEHLVGVEGGLSLDTAIGGKRLRLGITGYHNDLDDAVINATVRTSGALLFRQRLNLGAATTTGLEINARLAAERWDLSVAAAWMRSRIQANPVLPNATTATIIGNRLPQVPGYRLTASASYRGARWSAMSAVHATGQQFEDDRNSLALASGITVDASLSVPLTGGISLALRAQNLLDERLQVGRTPTLQLGPPRNVVLSLQLSSSRR